MLVVLVASAPAGHAATGPAVAERPPPVGAVVEHGVGEGREHPGGQQRQPELHQQRDAEHDQQVVGGDLRQEPAELTGDTAVGGVEGEPAVEHEVERVGQDEGDGHARLVRQRRERVEQRQDRQVEGQAEGAEGQEAGQGVPVDPRQPETRGLPAGRVGHSPRMNASSRLRPMSSGFCSGGDFMKYVLAAMTGPP